MQARRDDATARYAKVVADEVLLKRRYKGVVASIRHRQVDRVRFPHMPKAVTCRHGLGLIRAEYLKVISTTRKRTSKGGDITDLVSKSDELLARAHELVDQCCNDVHALVASRGKKFPVLPASDPRASALSKLNKEQRRLMQCIKRNTPDTLRDDIQDKLELLFEQALTILKSS
jgi:hypothetical protein